MTIEEKYELALKLLKSEYADQGSLYLAAFFKLVGEDFDWEMISEQDAAGAFRTPEIDGTFEGLLPARPDRGGAVSESGAYITLEPIA